MTSSPQMSAESRIHLVNAYMHLKPGENGVVTKEEAALTLMTTLQNELRRMPRTPHNDPAAYHSSLVLQANILDAVKTLPIDKLTPVLQALAQGPGPRSMDNHERPTSVRYGAQVTRDFVYGSEREIEGGVKSFTVRDGQSKETTYSYIGHNTWKNEEGKQITNVRVDFGKRAPDCIGDVSYNERGVSHIFRTNGAHIEITPDGRNKNVKVTYPAGKTYREFAVASSINPGSINPDQDTLEVTDSVTGQKEIWFGDLNNLRTRDGKQSVNNTTLAGYTSRDSLHPVQIERGDFTYIKDGVQHIIDSSGAEYQITNGVTLLAKSPDLPELENSSHPMQSVRAYAQMALARMQKSADVAGASMAPAKGSDYKRDFESVEKPIVRGQQQSMQANWYDHWQNICKKNGFQLLTRLGLSDEQNKRAASVDEQRGSLTSFFTSDSTKNAERARARQAVIPDMQREYEQFLATAMRKGGDLIQALAGNLYSDCKELPAEIDRLWARSKTIDAVCYMIQGQSDKREELAGVVASCLAEKPDLPRTDKVKLLAALDMLVPPNGTMSYDTAANIITASLEQEYKSMPGPKNRDARNESLALQESMLDRLQEWGNAQHLSLLASLTTLATEHNDPSLRDKAAQVRAELLRRAELGIVRDLEELVSQTAQGSW